MNDQRPDNPKAKGEVLNEGDRVLRKASQKSASENVSDEKQANRYRQNFVSFSDGMAAVSPLVLEDSITGERLYDAQENKDKLAWDPREQLKEWGEGLKKGQDNTNQAIEKARDNVLSTAEKSWYPFRRKEDKQIDYTACATAYRAFPEFARHPNIDRALIPAIIRNELHFYNLKEKPLEGVVNLFGDLPKDSLSIGPAQIQKQNIERLMQAFPQLSDPALGGITSNALKAALLPDKAAWLVAAFLAERIQQQEAAGQPVTHQDLIQTYNPGGERHFKHVYEQLIWIKNHHAGW